MWVAHGLGSDLGLDISHGAWSIAAEVGLFLLLLLHSLGYVLLFDRPGSRRHRLKWAALLAFPLVGPAAYLLRRRLGAPGPVEP